MQTGMGHLTMYTVTIRGNLQSQGDRHVYFQLYPIVTSYLLVCVCEYTVIGSKWVSKSIKCRTIFTELRCETIPWIMLSWQEFNHTVEAFRDLPCKAICTENGALRELSVAQWAKTWQNYYCTSRLGELVRHAEACYSNNRSNCSFLEGTNGRQKYIGIMHTLVSIGNDMKSCSSQKQGIKLIVIHNSDTW